MASFYYVLEAYDSWGHLIHRNSGVFHIHIPSNVDDWGARIGEASEQILEKFGVTCSTSLFTCLTQLPTTP